MLQIVSKIEERKSNFSAISLNIVNDFRIKAKGENSESKNNKLDLVDLDNTYNEFSQQKYSLCQKHNLITHSMSPRKEKNICDKCLDEDTFSSKPIPTIVKDLKNKISTGLTQIYLFEYEIDRISSFLNSYHNEFIESNTNKLETLFTYLTKIIEFNYNSALQLLQQCKNEQNSQITTIISEIENLKFELYNLYHELNKYGNIKEDHNQLLIKNLKRIEAIFSKLKSFMNYNSEIIF